MRLLFLIVALLFPLLGFADIYKWTDSNNVVHYSDAPHSGASHIQLPSDQTVSLAPAAPSSTSTNIVAEHNYQIKITQPVDNAAVLNNEQGNVLVGINLQPDLRTGDQMQLLLDDKPQGASQTAASFALANLDRGQHTLQVQVMDDKKNILGMSNKITINVQRASISSSHKSTEGS